MIRPLSTLFQQRQIGNHIMGGTIKIFKTEITINDLHYVFRAGKDNFNRKVATHSTATNGFSKLPIV